MAELLPGIGFGREEGPTIGFGGGVGLGGEILVQPDENGPKLPDYITDKSLPILPTGDEAWREILRGFQIELARADRDILRFKIARADQNASRILAGEPAGTFKGAEISRAYSSEERFARAAQSIQRAESLRPLLDEKDAEVFDLVQTPPQSMLGGAARDIARFMTWYAPAATVMKAFGLGVKTRAVLGGAAAETLAYDPSEMRLSNTLVDLAKDYPKVAQVLQEQLAADPMDEEGEARRKQMLEGALLAGIPEAVASGVGYLWRLVKTNQGRRTARNEAAAIGNPDRLGGFNIANHLPPAQAADFRAAEIANEIVIRDNALLDVVRGFGDEVTEEVQNLRIDRLVESYKSRLGNELRLPDADIEAKATQFRTMLGSKMLPLATGGEAGEQLLKRAEQEWYDWQNPIRPGLWTRLKETATTNIVDRSGNLKRELHALGPAGRNAVMMFDLTAGASPRAGMVFDTASKKIYGGRMAVDDAAGFTTEQNYDLLTGYLDPMDRQSLDVIIQARSLQQIMTRDPNFRAGFDITDTVTGKGRSPNALDFQAELQAQLTRLGPEKFALLNKRADYYFEEMRSAVDLLQENGLLKEGEAEALKRWDYSPTRFVDIIDPVDEGATKVNRQGKSISSSGIEALKNGDDAPFLADSQKFLAEVIGRTQSRIFRNRASLAVYEMGALLPDNGIVTLSKSEGIKNKWVQQTALVDGKQVSYWMEPGYYKEFAPEPFFHANAGLTALAGSTLVKPFATGINPEFIVTNFPRDLQHLWLSTSAYNNIAPIAAGQMAADLGAVWSDVVRRGPKFQEYMELGGGMNLLTHQGQLRSTATLPQSIKSRETGARLNEVFHALGYLNETSELLTRLMHVERLKKNGMTAQEAVWEARNRLDFSQGGRGTKALEFAFPYINAAVQGYRGVAREAAKDPFVFASKTAQLSGIFGSMWLSQAAMAGYKSVPAHVKAQNLVIMLPGVMEYDDNGPRYGYVTIPLDHSTVGLKTMVDSMMEKMHSGENPSKEQIKAMANSMAGIVPGATLPPSLSGLLALGANYNWWQNREIWGGDPAVPDLERYQINPDRVTSPVAVDVARILDKAGLGIVPGLTSPMQLEAAWGALVPQNVWTDLAGWTTAAMLHGADPRTQAETTADMLTNVPGLRRVLKFTQPFTEFAEEIQEAEGDRAGVKWSQNRELNFLIDNFLDGRTNQNRVEVLKFIDTQPFQDRVRLMDEFQTAEVLEAAVKRAGLPQGIVGPPVTWWKSVGALDIQTKAKLVADEAQEALTDEQFKDQRLSVIRTLLDGAPGFQGMEFRRELNRVLGDRGERLRL